ncbi:MAG TPA: prephenate dehydrogenase [Bacteroidetes bacterium]|nr:prephenate dehydrogenase [Bacteroidota bacterium]
MKVGIIGMGLIGGSMAIDLKKRNFATQIVGYDNSELHAKTALNLGIVDELSSLEDIVDSTDLIILAIPADATLAVLPKVMDLIDNQIVTDVCSIKGNLAEQVKYHQKRANYVAAHPMAGTEHTGPWAARSDLFDGKAVILCDAENSSEDALHTVRTMYDHLHMRPVYMNSFNHDAHAAYISHISHISSFALALTVLDKERNEKNIFDLASGGFDSTVRLAKSSADMWTPIFAQNADNVVTVLDTYIDKLQQFREAIEKNDKSTISHLITESNKIKKVLS